MDETKKEGLEFLNQFAGSGFEDLGMSDYALSFVKILQPLSPEVVDGGMKAGTFYVTGMNKNFGDTLTLLILHSETLWMEWAPKRGGLRGRHIPGSIQVNGDVYSGMTTPEGNDIVETAYIYGFIEGHIQDGPVVFPLSSTGIKHYQRWNSLIARTTIPGTTQRAPRFASFWKIHLVKNSNDQGVWYQLGDKSETKIEHARFVSKDELLQIVMPTRQLLTENSLVRKADMSALEKGMDRAALPAPDISEKGNGF